jgi:drug/metabolite transporter (DMT)-like permease
MRDRSEPPPSGSVTAPSGPVAGGPRSAIVRGILLMCLGVAMFPFLNASVKLLTRDYPVTEIVWARFTGHLIWVVILFFPKHGWRIFAARRPALQIARSFLLFGSTMFTVSAIGRLPLATASAIGFTSPFIVTALSVPLLGEPVGPRRWAAVCVGFLGALIVVRPQPSLSGPATLLALCAAGCYGLYQIMTRKGGAHDSAETGIVYAAVVGTVVSSLVAPWFGLRLPATPLDWLLFLAIGFFGGVGHYFVGRALQNVPAAVIAPFGYVEIIGTTILGYLIFANFPDFWTWVGIAVIIACGLYVGYRERVRRAEAREAHVKGR